MWWDVELAKLSHLQSLGVKMAKNPEIKTISKKKLPKKTSRVFKNLIRNNSNKNTPIKEIREKNSRYSVELDKNSPDQKNSGMESFYQFNRFFGKLETF